MKCSYCGTELPKNGGMMYVFRTGKINYYCSSRCYKYDIVLHRNLRKEVKGTSEVHSSAKQEGAKAKAKNEADSQVQQHGTKQPTS